VTAPAIRVLVVEDEADLADVLTRMLALEGWLTRAAGRTWSCWT
jgi:DNA-binding response OmpR family regulator